LFDCSDVSNKDLPHCTKLTEMIFQEYIKEHGALKEGFKNSLGRISFTADVWSDQNLIAYLAPTLHFCTRDD
ncbi:hypothetical protein PAXRUDRAFT_92123, partial [Paxillus rubicundulus Ve08.2h10]